MKLIFDNGTEVQLDLAGSHDEGEGIHRVGFDTNHRDLLSVSITLPSGQAERIMRDLGLWEQSANPQRT